MELQLLGIVAAIAAAMGSACIASVSESPHPPTPSVMLAWLTGAAASSTALAVIATLCRRHLFKGLLLLALVALTSAYTARVVISQANRGPECGGAATSLYAVEAMPSVVLGAVSFVNAGRLMLILPRLLLPLTGQLTVLHLVREPRRPLVHSSAHFARLQTGDLYPSQGSLWSMAWHCTGGAYISHPHLHCHSLLSDAGRLAGFRLKLALFPGRAR